MTIAKEMPWRSRDFSFLENQLRTISSALEHTAEAESIISKLVCGFFDELYDHEKDLVGKIVKVFFCSNNPNDQKNLTRIELSLQKTDKIFRSINQNLEQKIFPSYEKILDDQFKELDQPSKDGSASLEKWLCQYYQLLKTYRRSLKKSPNHLQEICLKLNQEGPPFFDKALYLKVKTLANFILFKLYLNCEIPFSLLKRAAEWESAAYLEEDSPEKKTLAEWCEQIHLKQDAEIIRKGVESFIGILNNRHVSHSFSHYECGHFLLNLSQVGFPLSNPDEKHLKWRSSLKEGHSYPALAYKILGKEEWTIPKLGPVLVGKHFKFDSHLIFEINEKEVLVIGCNRLMFYALEKAQKQFSSFLATPDILYTDPKRRFLIRKRLYRLDIKEYARSIRIFFNKCLEQNASPYEIETRYLLFDKDASPPELKSTKGLMPASFNIMALEKLAFELFSEYPEGYKQAMQVFKEHKNYKKVYENYQSYFMQIIQEASKDSQPEEYQDSFFENIEDRGVIQAGQQLYRDIRQLLERCKSLIDKEYVSIARRKNLFVFKDQHFFDFFYKEMAKLYKEQGGLGRVWFNGGDDEIRRSLIEKSKLFQKI